MKFIMIFFILFSSSITLSMEEEQESVSFSIPAMYDQINIPDPETIDTAREEYHKDLISKQIKFITKSNLNFADLLPLLPSQKAGKKLQKAIAAHKKLVDLQIALIHLYPKSKNKIFSYMAACSNKKLIQDLPPTLFEEPLTTQGLVDAGFYYVSMNGALNTWMETAQKHLNEEKVRSIGELSDDIRQEIVEDFLNTSVPIEKYLKDNANHPPSGLEIYEETRNIILSFKKLNQ